MDRGKLVYDIGFHKGEDIQYFLHLGCNVIGIDADPGMVERAKTTFSAAYASGQLKVFNYAISDKDNQSVEFNVSEWTLWNSLRKEVAARDNMKTETIEVPTTRLDSLMHIHGVPYYCKVDIEGYDALAVSTLAGTDFRPEFISVETECIGDKEIISDEKALETLDRLHELGYSKFKLVDQKTLEVLTMQPFYGVKVPPVYKRSLLDKVLGRPGVQIKQIPHFDVIKGKHGFDFPMSTTGPFGNQLEGEWMNYDQSRALLLFHRKMFFAQKSVNNYSFWCDWHATK